MRTLVDIPEPQLAKLTAISKAKKLSRAEVIRQAIATYVETQPTRPEDIAFGIWKGGEDGVKYQRRLRDEW
jgi:metal-responsive CopG/Arc/MetJ family transcriptional regulator